MRTSFTFESDRFNATEPRPHYVNPDCFGDDLACAIRDALRAAHVQVEDEPSGEDWGWELEFGDEKARHVLGIRCRPILDVDPYTGEPVQSNEKPERPEWCGIITRRAALLGRLLGKPKPAVSANMLELLHDILAAMDGVDRLRWSEPDGDPQRAAVHPTR